MFDYLKVKDARIQFCKVFPPLQDDSKTPQFYSSIINEIKLHINIESTKVAFIVVAHFVHSLPYFLESVGAIGDIVALIPKQSTVVANVFNTIVDLYKPIIYKDVNKDSLNNNQNLIETFFENLVKILQPQDKKIIILDHGGYFVTRMNDVLVKFKNRIIGVVEHTWNGEQDYANSLAKSKEFCVPVVSIAHSSLKDYESKSVARSIVDAINVKILSGEALNQDITRLQKILIIGYGNIGQRVALYLKTQLGSCANETIYICDASELALKEANIHFNEKHITNDKKIFLSQADLIITATSSIALNKQDFASLKPGVCIACATSSDKQFSADALADYEIINHDVNQIGHLNSLPKSTAKTYVMYRHKLQPDKIIYLASGGGSVNFLIGSTANPILHAIFASICFNASRLISPISFNKLVLNRINIPELTSDELIKIHWEKFFGPIDFPITITELIKRIFDSASKEYFGSLRGNKSSITGTEIQFRSFPWDPKGNKDKVENMLSQVLKQIFNLATNEDKIHFESEEYCKAFVDKIVFESNIFYMDSHEALFGKSYKWLFFGTNSQENKKGMVGVDTDKISSETIVEFIMSPRAQHNILELINSIITKILDEVAIKYFGQYRNCEKSIKGTDIKLRSFPLDPDGNTDAIKDKFVNILKSIFIKNKDKLPNLNTDKFVSTIVDNSGIFTRDEWELSMGKHWKVLSFWDNDPLKCMKGMVGVNPDKVSLNLLQDYFDQCTGTLETSYLASLHSK